MARPMAHPHVILLRSSDESEPDRYVAALNAVEFAATCEPVLAFRFPHGDVLRNALANRSRYAGLVVTSPRAVEAVVRVLDDDADASAAWHGAPAFAVGPKTAAALRDAGFAPRGADAGSAGDLAARITSDADVSSRRWLFLCGNRRRDALPDALRDAAVPFDEVEAYVTETRSDLRLPLDAEWLVFFSPSGVDAVRQSAVDASEYRCAAIGPTTAQAVRDTGLSVDAVAATPSPDALADAIRVAQNARVPE